MSKKEVYEQKAEALLLPIIEANNFELVDVEYVKEGCFICVGFRRMCCF